MRTVLVTILALAGSAQPARSQSALETDLRAAIVASGAEVAVAVRSLDGRTEVLIDADKPFHAASTMKVPVMIELYRQVPDGSSCSKSCATGSPTRTAPA